MYLSIEATLFLRTRNNIKYTHVPDTNMELRETCDKRNVPYFKSINKNKSSDFEQHKYRVILF